MLKERLRRASALHYMWKRFSVLLQHLDAIAGCSCSLKPCKKQIAVKPRTKGALASHRGEKVTSVTITLRMP